MRIYRQALAAVAALALPLCAQTVSQERPAPAGKTDKLWRIETTGIGG